MKIQRIDALDAFRGMTIAGMLLVNNPGSWAAIYPPLEHAPWHGWTPTDLIFPFFIFVVGITTHLSLEARAARSDSSRTVTLGILRRGGLIILLGLLSRLSRSFRWIASPSSGFPASCSASASAISGRRCSRVGAPAVRSRAWWFCS